MPKVKSPIRCDDGDNLADKSVALFFLAGSLHCFIREAAKFHNSVFAIAIELETRYGNICWFRTIEGPVMYTL